MTPCTHQDTRRVHLRGTDYVEMCADCAHVRWLAAARVDPRGKRLRAVSPWYRIPKPCA